MENDGESSEARAKAMKAALSMAKNSLNQPDNGSVHSKESKASSVPLYVEVRSVV